VSNLARNATWGGFSAAVRAATGLLIALLAVRLLGGERYGQLAALLSLFVVYLALNSSVFTVLVAKLMGLSVAERANKNANVLSAAKLLAVSSIVVLGFLTMLLWEMAPSIFKAASYGSDSAVDIRRAILVMGVLTAFQIMTALHAAIIEGAGRLDLAMQWQLVGPVLVTITLFSLLILQVPVSVSEYVAVLCGGAVCDLCLLLLVQRKLVPLPPSLSLSREKQVEMWALLKSGTTLQAAWLMNLFLEPLNKFLLNHFAGALAATAYDLVMKLIWGIQSLFSAAMRIFLHLSGEQGQLVGRAFSRMLTLVLVPVVAAHVVAAIFLTWVVHQWIMIGDTRQIMIFFAIATASNLGMIYVTPPYTSLIGRGDLRFIFRSQTIVAVTNVMASLAFIPLFGLLGAACGLLCATTYNVVAIYRRHEQIVGASGGLLPIIRGRSGRYFFTALLLAAAILIGSGRVVNYYVAAVIFLAIALIMKNEPLVGMLFTRIRGNK
jgi:O-antigen/teichoic acid export membrane protein